MKTEFLLKNAAVAMQAAMDRPVHLAEDDGEEMGDKPPRRRRVLFYSGAKVARFNPWTGEQYDLSFAMDGADLSRMPNAPVLDGHQSGEAEYVLGVVEAAGRSAAGYEAELRFSAAEDVDPIWKRIEEGILRNVSMGVEIQELEVAADSDAERRHYLARKWRPYEISVVPLGADPSAQFLAASHRLAAATSAASGAEKNRALHELALRERRWRVLGRI